MPRDDTYIDGFWNDKMPLVEHQDAAAVLDDFVNRVANLPEEIRHMQDEIAAKDRKLDVHMDTIKKYDEQIQRWIRNNGGMTTNPKEEQLRAIISKNYEEAGRLQDEKVALAAKSMKAVERHMRALDVQIKGLQERGDFPNDADIPSLLKPKIPSPVSSRVESSNIVRPSNQEHNSASVPNPLVQRHVNTQVSAQRTVPAQAQAQNINVGISVSAPATPAAAAALILQRQHRESSAGAPPKRQRTGLGTVPNNPSNLAKTNSVGPSTPKAGTPTATRAGSAQPRVSQKKEGVNKKVAPHKLGGVARKGKPGKSGLSRLKRTGNKNSPSSTNDSELSDAESASEDEPDEATTPPPAHKDVDGDEDMVDVDDDENSDDKKYCTCQSVSYGDMVACDNDTCPYEWFHWTCVGLKSEPVGTWICPVCTKNQHLAKIKS